VKNASGREPPARQELFEVARQRASWTVEQLWVHYLALGGTLVVFDLEAYLCGLMSIPPGQQDVLACALNERLADLHEPAEVPYLTAQQVVLPSWEVLNLVEGLRAGHRCEQQRET
jgi:hypothetical protein